MFQSARLSLTAWYLIIIMCVSFAFSAVIYSFLSHEVERFARVQRFRIERQKIPFDNIPPPEKEPPQFDPDLINETKYRILYYLVLINGIIIIIAGGMGYVLAGRTLRPIQEMVDEQHRFIQDASHELRTPLTALKSSLEVSLMDSKVTMKELKDTIRNGISDADKLQSLTDALLRLAHYENASQHPDKVNIGLLTSISVAQKSVSALAKAKKITIKVISDDCEFHAYEESFIELLRILMENAIKYSPAKSTVTIFSDISEKTIKISVSDEGIGIEPKDLPNIFDRFYRADRARTKNDASGYGLGLSIAKQLAHLHNGSIDVKSMPDKGSTFTITIPNI